MKRTKNPKEVQLAIAENLVVKYRALGLSFRVISIRQRENRWIMCLSQPDFSVPRVEAVLGSEEFRMYSLMEYAQMLEEHREKD